METKIASILKNLRILYVEDDDAVRTRLGAKLSRLSALVIEAKDGQEALELFEAQRPDIIIADICMPRLGGLDLMRAIRLIDKDVPAIVTTAYINEEYLLDSVRLSLEDYLLKPIVYTHLMCVLQKSVVKLIDRGRIEYILPNQAQYNLLNKNLITSQGETIELSHKEEKLLTLLIHNRHRILTNEEIALRIWGDEVMTDGALKSLLVKLRRKVGRNTIVNTPRSGYQIAKG